MNALLSLTSPLTQHRRGALAALLLALTSAAAGMALLGVSGWFLTGAALTTAGLAFNLFGPSALVRAFSMTRIGARYGEKLIGHDVTLRSLADTRERIFRQLIPRAPLRVAGLRHGDLVSRLVADVEALEPAFMASLGPVLATLLMGASLSTFLASLSAPAALVFVIGFAGAALVAPFFLVMITRRTGRDLAAAKARLRILALDAIEGHADLRLFDRTEAAQAAFAVEAEALARIARRQSRAGVCATAAVISIGGLASLGVLVAGLPAVALHQIGGPVLVGLMLAATAVFEGAAVSVRSFERLGSAIAGAERLQALTSAPTAFADPGKPYPLPPGVDLVFDHVTFAYRPERPVLRACSLTCPAGSRTAIVGDSGCGKSTLLNLALRLEAADAGAVRVAGADVREVAAGDLHARVALMSQSTPVFLGTIGDNLRLANPDAKDADLWDALARARLADFVRKLPQGLDEWCGEGGRTFSLGQARRLCLARTLLTPAAILLLDEPTSGLDREVEQAFFRDLRNATADRTVLVVTHADLPPGAVDRVFRLVEGELLRADRADQSSP